MNAIPTYPLTRVLTVAEADDLIGNKVPAQTATVFDRGLYYDAATEEPLFAYLDFTGDLERLRGAVRATPMGTLLRGSGTRNKSRTFGFAARNVVLRREACKPAALAIDEPTLHAELVAAGVELDRMVREVAPDRVAADAAVVGDVLDEWRLAEGVGWTSGNINQSSALPYHRDRANFATWSAMPVVRRGVRGGFLSVPEYGAVFACDDGTCCFFNGNVVVHGVTPMEFRSEDAYRFSIVYYALRGMKDCFTVALEQSSARKRRSGREVGFADPEAALKVTMPLNARRAALDAEVSAEKRAAQKSVARRPGSA